MTQATNQLPRPTAEERQASLLLLKEQGLDFHDCIRVFGVQKSEHPLAQLADDLYGREGQLEFDDYLVVGESGDAGDYIMAWRWVDDPNAESDDEDEDEDEGDANAGWS